MEFWGGPSGWSAPLQFGGHTGRETPLPIPNREVKPARADGTRRATSRESRSPPDYFAKPAPMARASLVSGKVLRAFPEETWTGTLRARVHLGRCHVAFAGFVVAVGQGPALAERDWIRPRGAFRA